MDLWQLHIFVTVVEKKSFSKASQVINLSQPTVSTHIKELEEHFQCRLLDRLGKTTEPTRAGKILYDHAKKLLEFRNLTESAMLDFLGHTKGTLNIGGSTIPAGYLIPKLIGVFSKKFPDVILSLTAGDTIQIIDAIKKGKIEMGVVGALKNDPAIYQEKLMADEMKLIVPAGHKWAGRKSIDCSKIFLEPFITREKGSGTWQSILKSMDKAGFNFQNLNTRITMGNSVSVIQGILNKVGISILSTIAVANEIETGRVHALRVKGLDLDRYFYLTLAKKRTQSPICQRFIDFIRQNL
ncbi:MAG: LysR family transcriptional regulator [Desulfobacteraceae bacterium]|nr:LysR family transcriptional regulator [Desulfobacteraceae bacterium]